MLIGFASTAVPVVEGAHDAVILQQLGCERIFSAADGVFIIEDVINYLRSGDVLAVADLSRLGKNLEQLVQLLERLHLANVRVHVAGTDVIPGTPLGESFAKACATLAEFSRTNSENMSAALRIRGRRGRPVALPPEAQVRAERMIKDGQTSVSEIARVLKVSTATLYRYFPRSSRMAKIKTQEKTPRSFRAAEQPRPTKR